jgi:hypothetical protein
MNLFYCGYETGNRDLSESNSSKIQQTIKLEEHKFSIKHFVKPRQIYKFWKETKAQNRSLQGIWKRKLSLIC